MVHTVSSLMLCAQVWSFLQPPFSWWLKYKVLPKQMKSWHLLPTDMRRLNYLPPQDKSAASPKRAHIQGLIDQRKLFLVILEFSQLLPNPHKKRGFHASCDIPKILKISPSAAWLHIVNMKSKHLKAFCLSRSDHKKTEIWEELLLRRLVAVALRNQTADC